MDYQIKYEEIVAAYNREKDRATIEDTFANLLDFVRRLDDEEQRAARENLTQAELAVFDLLRKETLSKTERETVKQASRDLLASIQSILADLDRFWEKEQTKGEVQTFILDAIYPNLPAPPYTEEEKELIAANVYAHAWRQAVSGAPGWSASRPN
jgi:type I restriction enzyme R subunit